ncbi:hypothetical protein D9M69_480480 [compost metagenome]
MHGLGQHHGRYQIDVQRLQPVLTAGGKTLVAIGAGQIHQSVNATEAGSNLLHRISDMGVVGDVHVEVQCSVTKLGGNRSTALAVDVE